MTKYIVRSGHILVANCDTEQDAKDIVDFLFSIDPSGEHSIEESF